MVVTAGESAPSPSVALPAAALAEYPFTSRWFDVDGVRLHYVDEGPRSGPPVVMLHGNPTWSYYYRHLIRAVADRYRAIVPDHVGMGFSSKPTEERYGYTLDRRVDDLDRLLEHLDLSEPLTLVVHDWGGLIGMAYADRHPQRIARLVVLNTAAFRLPANKRLPLPLLIARLPVLGAVLIRGLNAFCRGAARRCVRRPLPSDIRRAYLAPYGSWADRVAVYHFVRDIPLGPADPSYATLHRVEERLAQWGNRPMLLAWGLADFVFDADYLAEWQHRFPSAQVLSYADAGHYVLEDARDDLVPRIRQFLDRTENVVEAGAAAD